MKKTIVVTGGAGFIGSAFVWKLNQEGIDDIIVVDNLASSQKWKNLAPLRYTDYIHKDEFFSLMWDGDLGYDIDAVVHMGACSSTTETNADYLYDNNFRYSRELYEYCEKKEIRFLYASSAATYGDGAKGFSDADSKTPHYLPINMYGYSKQLFDMWMLKQPYFNGVGLKFFNVYGANEYHKGDMSSMVFKAYHQILQTGEVNLFKSQHPDYADGGQMRDFVYIKDVVEVMYLLLMRPQINGIFNLGSGRAHTWLELMNAVFNAMGRSPKINFIDMPPNLRHSYQYFTQAEMGKLENEIGVVEQGMLEENVRDYVQNHLMQPQPHLSSLE